MRTHSQRIQSDRIIERRRRASLGSRLAGPVLASLVWLVGAPTGALADTFVVTKTADTNDGSCDADCSLREAIIAANANGVSDTITFINLAPSPDLYTLTIAGAGEDASATGDLDITGLAGVDDLVIQGNAASETIIQAGATPGTGIDRVFHVVSTARVMFNGVTIRHGTITGDGGGIFSNAASGITLTNSVVQNNQASVTGGGIVVNAVSSQLTLTNSVVSGNSSVSAGGGIRCVNCALNVTASLVSSNIANGPGNTDDGGGITAELASTVTILNSTITNNQAGDQGGGLHIAGTSTATITGTNIAGNSGGGGAQTGDGIAAGDTANVTVSSSRFHNNGTGLARQNTATAVATNNWWGCDGFPGAAGCDGVVNLVLADYDPRIDLRVTAAPPVIAQLSTSTLTADVTLNSNGAPVPGAPSPALEGLVVTFTPGPLGTVMPVTAPITNGMASTTFTGNTVGLATPSAALDNGTQNVNVNIVTIPTLTINDVAMAEGNAGTTNFIFTVTRSHDLTALSVNYQTADGTATVVGGDYQANMNTLMFMAGGSLTQMVTVLVNGDLVVEGNETFFVNLSNPVNASIVDGQGMGTIQNDDMATISINDPAGVNEATGMVTFTVTLNGTVQGGFNVNFSTADGTASAAGDNDYTAIVNGQVVFAGTMNETQPLQVTVNDDAKVELDETFLVNLAAPGGGFPAGVTILDGQGIGTILTDDQAGISINNVAMNEGNTGTTQFTFTVTLDAEVDVPVNVPFTTQNMSAIAPGDYLANSGTVVFPVGMANQTQDIVVDVNGDTTVEPTETFHVALTGINATGREMNGNIIITQQPGVGTIQNDDDATVSITDVMLAEGAGGGTTNFVFNVTLSAGVDVPVSVDFATANGSATTGDGDYNVNGGTVNFAVGTTGPETITVTVNNDAKVELDETFDVNLSNIQASGRNVNFLDAQGLGTIVNDDAATISINNVMANEGAGGATTNFVFDVTMTTVVDTLVTVDFATADGSATTADGDYVANASTVNFAAGNTGPQTITVTVNNDAKVELNETFDVNLSNIQAGGRDVTFLVNQGVGTIQNDDLARITIGDVTQNEGNAGPTNFAFTATLLDAVDTLVTVDFMTSDSSATVADADYLANTGMITFNGAAGNPQTINITVNGDTKVELNESFLVQLSNIQAGGRNVVFDDAVAVGNITNDDSAGLSINDVSVNEGAAGEMPLLTFTVTLSADLFAPLTVDFATANGSATAGSDYTANNGTLNFAGMAGETQTFDVTITGDDIVELDENFVVNLSNIQASMQNVGFDKQQGTGTITNDDMATLTINDVTQNEGNAGATNFMFDVTLSHTLDTGFTLNFATSDSTATAGSDYTANSGMLTFAGNANEVQSFNVSVMGDALVELDEQFQVTLSNLTAGRDVQLDTQAVGTIVNDDSASVMVGDVMANENAGGTTTNFVFNVTLSAPADTGVSVDFTTIDGSATTADGDYTAQSGTVNFPSGDVGPQTITVTVNGDAKVEPDETFNVNLSNIQAAGRSVAFGDAQGLGTIGNDDAATITIGDVSMNEGSGGGTTTFSFAVTLDAELGSSVTVDYATADNTATIADNDYAAATNTLTFTGVAETQTIDVLVTADNQVEPTETFFVNLSNLQTGGLAVTLADNQGLGTIVTDDAATVSIDDVTMNEGPQGTPATFRFTVSLSAPVAGPVSVNFATANMTATTADGDYVQAGGTLNFSGAMAESMFVDVTVNGDNKVESNETFAVNLSNLQAGSLMVALGKQQGIGTIVNDDGMASISIADVTQQEGSGGGSTIFNFTVTLDKQVGGAISVSYATANGTATTADGDYTPANGTLNFQGNAGEQHDISITVSADDDAELDEMFFVNLSNLQAGGLPVVFANQQGIGTILNDDDIGACGEPNNLVIDGRAFSGSETVVACQTLTIGPNVQILGSANVVFQAGQSVILANGLSVQAGAVLTIELDPSLLVP